MTVMSAMSSSPPVAGPLNGTSPSGKQEILKWERGIVGTMRPESMISYVRQFCDNAGGKITIVPAVMPKNHMHILSEPHTKLHV